MWVCMLPWSPKRNGESDTFIYDLHNNSKHFPGSCFFTITYVIGEEANCHANDEDGPEDVETLQRHQEAVEKVVAKEGLIDGHRVNPRAVNDPSAERARGTLKSSFIVRMINPRKRHNPKVWLRTGKERWWDEWRWILLQSRWRCSCRRFASPRSWTSLQTVREKES